MGYLTCSGRNQVFFASTASRAIYYNLPSLLLHPKTNIFKLKTKVKTV